MLPTVAPQSCSSKLFLKAASQSCYPALLPKAKLKPILQSGSDSAPKLLPKAAPQRCCPKLLPQSYDSSQTYTSKRVPKAILQSGSRKLLPKVASESCSLKLFVKLPPKAAPQSHCSSTQLFFKLFRKACPSCSPKRFREAASQSCPPPVAPKRLCFKPVPQSRSPKLLSKAAPNSCSPKLLKLLPKVVSESCFPKLLSKATAKSCRSSKQLFVNAAAKLQSCSPKLPSKVATESKEAPQNSARRLRKQAQCAVERGCSKRAVSQRCVLERAQKQ